MGDYPWRVQLLYATCLCLALLLFFLPLPTGWVVIGCVLTVLVSGYIGWRTLRYTKQVRHVSPYLDALEKKLETLPDRLRHRLPVILVTGDATANYFFEQENQHVAVTGKSIWVAVPEIAELSLTADALIGRWPEMAGRIGVLLALTPERYDDKRTLIGYLQRFRQLWADICKTCGYKLPGYLTVNAHLGEQSAEPQWFCWSEQSLEIRLLDDNHTLLEQWIQQGNEEQKNQRQRLAVMLKTLQEWLKSQVIQVLSDTQQPVSPWIPGAVACLNVSFNDEKRGVWQGYLRDITTLSLPKLSSALPKIVSFPEKLVETMPVSCRMSGRKRAVCHALILTALFVAIAMCSSAYNNTQFLKYIADDLHAYNRVPMDSYDDKLNQLNRLKLDKQLLDKNYREGVPERLGMGLYLGGRLILPVDTAIRSYQPPPPPPPPPVIEVPKVVRLDSMSLFDTGKSVLKTGSTKILVDALINIKAKPGWLILIAGHTDITGDPERNQMLSLSRAESVRDWMIETSDIDKTCFAIQGYGATQPIADNDTAEGRAANRRVEISLVPETSACQPNVEHQVLQQN